MKKNIIKIFAIMILVSVICIIVFNYNREKDIEELEEEILDAQIILYFAREGSLDLEKEYRYVSIKDIKEDMVGTIIKELQKGPTTEGLYKTMPEGTIINNYKILDNIVVLDLSKEFEENNKNTEIASAVSVFSIVNSLTEITEIDAVKFLIDGKEKEKYRDSFKFNEAFVREI